MEQQTHRLEHRLLDNPLWVAASPEGHLEGYLFLQSGSERLEAREVTADNWPAALALLQQHAQLLDGPTTPATLRYRLPPTSPLLQWMIDHLEVLDTSHWKHPADEWVVHSQTYHHRDAGWMARLVHLPTLVQTLLPQWQARWRHSLSHWTGDVLLLVGGEPCMLRIEGTELRLISTSTSAADAIELTPQTFTRIVFGYRPVSYAMQQEKQFVKSDLLAVLNVLFPTGHTWIPGSDWF